MIDIRRAIEALVPDAKWDFSIHNEGGTEQQYNAIGWTDERSKPAWAEIMSVATSFEAADLLAARQGMECGALQMRRALRQLDLYTTVTALVPTQNEETQEAWEYATTFKRLDPFIVQAISALEKTDEEGDVLFQLAVTL